MMGSFDLAPRSRYRYLCIVLLFAGLATGSGLYSLFLGADRNWDLMNYHLYIPFASLNNRLAYDIEPAQGQTYLNPALDVPFYFLVRYFNDFPRLIGFLQGMVNAVDLLCTGLLAWQLLGRLTGGATWLRRMLSVTAVVVGGSGAVSRGLIGSTTGDTQVACFVMLALVFAVRSIDNAVAGVTMLGNLAASGLLAGLAFGLKPTTGPFCVGLFFALAMLPQPCRTNGAAVFVVAGLSGCVIAGGYHALTMYELFSNPVFPAFDYFFHSRYFGSVDVINLVKRGSMFEVLSFPFASIWLPRVLSGGYFIRDIRPALAVVLGLLMLGGWVLTKMTGKRIAAPERSIVAMAIFVLVSLYVSLAVFNNYRYLGPIESVSGVLIVVALGSLLPRSVWIAGVLAAATACLVSTVPLVLPRAPWVSQYISVSGPDLDADTLVVISLLRAPVGYLAPFFNPGVRWVRVRSNVYPANSNNLLAETAKRLVATHEGPLMSLELPASTATDVEVAVGNSILAELSVERTGEPCLRVAANFPAGDYAMCPIRNRRD